METYIAATTAVMLAETKLTALLLKNSQPEILDTVGPGLDTTLSFTEQNLEYCSVAPSMLSTNDPKTPAMAP